MDKTLYLLLAGLICFLSVCLERGFPFLVFPKGNMPTVMNRYVDDLPQAIIAALVVYCMKDQLYSLTSASTAFTLDNLFLLISVIVVIASYYLCKKNLLISIGLGTVLYMVLVAAF